MAHTKECFTNEVLKDGNTIEHAATYLILIANYYNVINVNIKYLT